MVAKVVEYEDSIQYTEDSILRRGHGTARHALERTAATPSSTARLDAFFEAFKPEFVQTRVGKE